MFAMDNLCLLNTNSKVNNTVKDVQIRTIGTNTENSYTHVKCPFHQRNQHQVYYVPYFVPQYNVCCASSYMPHPYEHHCGCRSCCCADSMINYQCVPVPDSQHCSMLSECKCENVMSHEIPLSNKPTIARVDCATQMKLTSESEESLESYLNTDPENNDNQENGTEMHQCADNKFPYKRKEKDDKCAKKNYLEERRLLENLLTPTSQFNICKGGLESEDDSDDCIEICDDFDTDHFSHNTSTKLITKGETETIQHKNIECQRKQNNTKNEATNTKNKLTDVAMIMMMKTIMEEQNQGGQNLRVNKLLNRIVNGESPVKINNNEQREAPTASNL